MTGILHDLLFDHTLRTVALGAAVVGVSAGTLGVFAVLRRQSLLGDAVSHAALPGICLAFILTLSKQPLVLVLGAFVAGWLGTLLINQVTGSTKIKSDAAMGIVLAVFFGLGLVLMTYIQGMPAASQAGLDKFLFGNAATMLTGDVIIMSLLGGVALLLVVLFWKEFKLLTFDRDYAQSLGWSVRTLEILLTTLIVLAIVTGLQAVGVVLMSALLIAPAAAARQWSDKLAAVVVLSAAFGALGGVSGAVISSTTERLPTGPAIVLIISILAIASLLLAPARGLLWAHLRHLRQHREVNITAVLAGMYQLVEGHNDPLRPHAIGTLDAVGLHAEEKTIPLLVHRGWVVHDETDWHFTAAGLSEARRRFAEYAGGAR